MSLSSSDIHEKLSNIITVVTSPFLVGVAILGFGVLSLTFVAFLALATSLVGLVPAVFRSVTSLRARMTDSILREHSDPSAMGLTTSFLPCLLFVQLPSECTCRTIASSTKVGVLAKRHLADGQVRLTSLIASETVSPLCSS